MITRSANDILPALVGSIYDAALDQACWPAFLERLVDIIRGDSANIFMQDLDSNTVPLMVSVRTDPYYTRLYETYYASVNPLIEPLLQVPQGDAITSSHIMSPQALEKTEFYSDYLRPRNVAYVLGGMIMKSETRVSALSIYRPRRADGFSEHDLRTVRFLMPHVTRALQIDARLRALSAERGAALEALDRLAAGVAVVTREGRILHANPGAEACLRESTHLRGLNGHISIADPILAGRFSHAIQNAVDTAAGQGTAPGELLIVPRADRLPLTLSIAPFRPAREGFGAPQPAALILIKDPEISTVPSSALQSLFGLTKAEAIIACALAQGKTLDEIAAAQSIGRNTARTHLKHILFKTGTNRQAQLVSVLLRSAAAARSAPFYA